MEIKETAENYLETILMLSQNNERVRAVDIAKNLNCSKPTVSVAMKQFRENGYIKVNEDGHITLTKKGKDIASRMYERHNIIADALIKIGVDEKTAYKDACKIEHDISDESFVKLKEHLKNI